MEINLVDLINDIYYAIETLRDDPSRQEIRPGCDCGCGGDTFDFDSYDEEYRQAIATLASFDIQVVQ